MKRYFLSLFVCLLAVGGALPSAAQNMYRERLPEEFSPTIDSWDSNGGWNTQSYPINRLVDGNMGTVFLSPGEFVIVFCDVGPTAAAAEAFSDGIIFFSEKADRGLIVSKDKSVKS